jgi:hypothetical protein
MMVLIRRGEADCGFSRCCNAATQSEPIRGARGSSSSGTRQHHNPQQGPKTGPKRPRQICTCLPTLQDGLLPSDQSYFAAILADASGDATPAASGSSTEKQAEACPETAQRIEMHKRVVRLAELLLDARRQLRMLDDAKAALHERKALQQARLSAALDARLAAADAVLHPHRCVVCAMRVGGAFPQSTPTNRDLSVSHPYTAIAPPSTKHSKPNRRVALYDRVQALERAAACFKDALRGLAPEPEAAAWQKANGQFERLAGDATGARGGGGDGGEAQQREARERLVAQLLEDMGPCQVGAMPWACKGGRGFPATVCHPINSTSLS